MQIGTLPHNLTQPTPISATGPPGFHSDFLAGLYKQELCRNSGFGVEILRIVFVKCSYRTNYLKPDVILNLCPNF